ncbi:MAG: transporter permease [Sphingomonas bacterium]|uniref:ABC transporter permease n=1 Tax=Sphingomonas bacterium TaxID=1895847 RepID=UPI00260CDF13|nr:ABC transporter permease [Sphingomonas bacterium]MDB5703949.1 transporter permease [Sphingomonas bacterium]
MWRNYMTVGIRALAKNRAYAFINIAGLALGIAACLLILGFVRYEMSYDAWLPDADKTFQFQDFYHPTKEGGEEYKLQITSYPAGIALKKDFPQVEHAVYVMGSGAVILKDGQPEAIQDGYLADGPLFDVLRLPFLYGDPAHALDDPHALTLNETEATKLFGAVNPVGRTVTLVSRNLSTDYRVTGVFKDIPKNSSLEMTMVARFDPQSYFADIPYAITSWNNQNGGFFVRLRDGADAATINAGLPAWEKRNIPDEDDGDKKSNAGDNQDWKLANIRDVHLGAAQMGSMRPGNDMRTIVTFAIVALLILGMACVNFTNLATARATQRAREVALRKVLGATRKQLIVQFIGESILLASIAMLVALALVELVLPGLNNFLDAQINLRYFALDGLILPVIGLTLLVGLAGGVYPAFVLSRFEPARVLKANKSAADAEGSGLLRNALVVGQFAVSIGLIICTSVVYAQTVYARTSDAGYHRDSLLQIDGIGRPQVEAVMTSLLDEVKRTPGVTTAGRTQIAVVSGRNSVTEVQVPGSPNRIALGNYGIDPGFFETMGMKIVAGRNFSESQPRDDVTTPSPMQPDAERALVARGANVILSEEAAHRIGYKNPSDALGKTILAGITLPEYGQVPVTVVGIVTDARFRSVRDPLQPIMYYYQTRDFNQLMVRFQGIAPSVAYGRIEAVWKKQVPDIPFRAKFVDDIVRTLYNADEARAELFGAFAILAVVIGCLGLFGLAAFTAERRTKEIGIRKVLGARTRDILRLLVWQFSRPVLIANLIAWPVAWWVMRGWLNGFDTRIALTPVPFLAAGALAVVIAIGTISAHAYRVARTSPIRALRYE